MSDRPSLERVVESADLGLEVLHPGSLHTTRELAARCEIAAGTRVLDLASGTGESACFLTDELGAVVTGVDRSSSMVHRARAKADRRGLRVRWVHGDAHRLPFAAAGFDVAICECTLSLLDKGRALGEMVRVLRPGGRLGFHEICWKEGTPRELRRRLFELEGERPETLVGWRSLTSDLDVEDVRTFDRSELLPTWMKESRRELGARGVIRAGARVLSMWGPAGLWRVLQSVRLFGNDHLGYGMVVARKHSRTDLSNEPSPG